MLFVEFYGSGKLGIANLQRFLLGFFKAMVQAQLAVLGKWCFELGLGLLFEYEVGRVARKYMHTCRNSKPR